MATGVVAEDLVKAGTQKGCDNPTALWPSTSFLNLVQSGKRRERDSLDLFAVKASMLPDADAYAAAERLDQRYAYRFFKRLFDITFSALVLALLSGPMLLVALAIKLDSPGPALFRQKRVTKGGRHFYIWKFRSMYQNAEKRLPELRKLNERDGPVFKIKDDPRVTRVGRFIRKTSIDELPQFFNVLVGDISVVGPRPALPSEVARYTERHQQRLLVKGGITCYWQTRHNKDYISFDDWVSLDLLYVKQCSLWVDLKLIIQTIGVVLVAQGS